MNKILMVMMILASYSAFAEKGNLASHYVKLDKSYVEPDIGDSGYTCSDEKGFGYYGGIKPHGRVIVDYNNISALYREKDKCSNESTVVHYATGYTDGFVYMPSEIISDIIHRGSNDRFIKVVERNTKKTVFINVRHINSINGMSSDGMQWSDIRVSGYLYELNNNELGYSRDLIVRVNLSVSDVVSLMKDKGFNLDGFLELDMCQHTGGKRLFVRLDKIAYVARPYNNEYHINVGQDSHWSSHSGINLCIDNNSYAILKGKTDFMSVDAFNEFGGGDNVEVSININYITKIQKWNNLSRIGLGRAREISINNSLDEFKQDLKRFNEDSYNEFVNIDDVGFLRVRDVPVIEYSVISKKHCGGFADVCYLIQFNTPESSTSSLPSLYVESVDNVFELIEGKGISFVHMKSSRIDSDLLINPNTISNISSFEYLTVDNPRFTNIYGWSIYSNVNETIDEVMEFIEDANN